MHFKQKSDPSVEFEFALQKFDIPLNYLMEILLKFSTTRSSVYLTVDRKCDTCLDSSVN